MLTRSVLTDSMLLTSTSLTPGITPVAKLSCSLGTVPGPVCLSCLLASRLARSFQKWKRGSDMEWHGPQFDDPGQDLGPAIQCEAPDWRGGGLVIGGYAHMHVCTYTDCYVHIFRSAIMRMSLVHYMHIQLACMQLANTLMHTQLHNAAARQRRGAAKLWLPCRLARSTVAKKRSWSNCTRLGRC